MSSCAACLRFCNPEPALTTKLNSLFDLTDTSPGSTIVQPRLAKCFYLDRKMIMEMTVKLYFTTLRNVYGMVADQINFKA